MALMKSASDQALISPPGVIFEAGGASGGAPVVVDGPFTEAKELVGGYAVIEVRSSDEALELGRRLMQIHKDNWPGFEGSVEIRRIAEF